MRGLFRNFPPRMVSRKCTCQLSCGFTLPMAAAIPPSAITVCALPNSDLVRIATRLPAWRPAIAARSPAPPAPMISTSNVSLCSCSPRIEGPVIRSPRFAAASGLRAGDSPAGSSDDPEVGDVAGRDEPDVHVGQHQRAQGGPGQLHVFGVERGDPRPHLVADRVAGEMPQLPAEDVPAGAARRGV